MSDKPRDPATRDAPSGNVIPFGGKPGEVDWRAQLRYKPEGKGIDLKALQNFRLFATHHADMAGRLRYDEFSARTMIRNPPWRPGEAERPTVDSDATRLREWLQGAELQPTAGEAADVLDVVAEDNRFHAVRDYLGGIAWDGIARIDHWLTDCAGSPDTAYTRSVAAKYLIAAVARAYRPGSQVDSMLVLEGPEGRGKSSLFRVLFGPDWTMTAERSLFADHKRFLLIVQGAWCIELAELAAMDGSDHGNITALITTTADVGVPMNGRRKVSIPRGFVFAGTVNPTDTGYLANIQGNRRYWPVPVGDIDLAALGSTRDQLWAEAVARFTAGEAWWFDREQTQAARREQAAREHEDSWIDRLGEAMANEPPVAEMTIGRALTLLGIPAWKHEKKEQMRAATALRALGWTKTEVFRAGRSLKIWRLKNGAVQ